MDGGMDKEMNGMMNEPYIALTPFCSFCLENILFILSKKGS
jgi:hypothetical protein